MPTPEQPGQRPEAPEQFVTTHWSVVLAAGDPASPQASAALETLCRAYWYPLYVYVRRSGHSPPDAEDLTQEFFSRFLQKNAFAEATHERGRFRSFLLTSLKNFLANEYHRGARLKRGGGQSMMSLDWVDGEDRYLAEPMDTATPEALYEQRWALTLLETALARLREEYAATGRGPLFDLLKSCAWGERNAVSYAELAVQLDLTEEAVKKAVQRLRQRYRAMLRSEIAQTVSTVAEVEEELQYLAGLLRK